ncbi:hypothetical protein J4471_04645 [Candidatus Woesearchaeota archaeon]|nr:hypothetical protein [Candidatus Woesearchaeota archaeon]
MFEGAESINVVPDLKIDWKGIFDFSDLYKKIKIWLLYEGYGDENENFIEAKYIERIKPNGKQIEAKWYAEKPVNDYVSNYLTLTFTVVGLKDTEITIEGKKMKMNSGQVIISIKGDLVINRKGDFGKGSLLQKIHDRRLFRKNIELYKEELYKKTTDLYIEIKAYLNLHQF